LSELWGADAALGQLLAFRASGVAVRIRVLRVRCEPCASSHALLPAFCLLRRLDSVEVIGPALVAGVEGASDAVVAKAIDVPATTVRGWRRAHHDRAALLVAGVVAVAVGLGGVDGSVPVLSARPERASLEAVGVLWATTRRLLGARAGPAWRTWSVVTGGGALAANTIPPWTGPDGAASVVPVPGTIPGRQEMSG
jgi:hypothetical protein